MRKVTQITIILLVLIAINFQVLGQDSKPKSKLFLLHQDVIKVDMVKQYVDNVKKELELWKKHGMETVIKYASKTDDNRFNFLTPLDSYADMDKQGEYWTNFVKKAGEETVKKLYEDYADTYVSHKNVIIKRNDALSYWPENNRLKDEKAEFLHFDHYSFKEGEIDNAMKMMKEFKDLMIEKKSDDAYTVWVSDIGGDIGNVVVVRAAKNNVDYYQEANKRMESMSEQLKKMWPGFSKTLKHFDHNNGKPMPEFLYSPGE